MAASPPLDLVTVLGTPRQPHRGRAGPHPGSPLRRPRGEVEASVAPMGSSSAAMSAALGAAFDVAGRAPAGARSRRSASSASTSSEGARRHRPRRRRPGWAPPPGEAVRGARRGGRGGHAAARGRLGKHLKLDPPALGPRLHRRGRGRVPHRGRHAPQGLPDLGAARAGAAAAPDDRVRLEALWGARPRSLGRCRIMVTFAAARPLRVPGLGGGLRGLDFAPAAPAGRPPTSAPPRTGPGHHLRRPVAPARAGRPPTPRPWRHRPCRRPSTVHRRDLQQQLPLHQPDGVVGPPRRDRSAAPGDRGLRVQGLRAAVLPGRRATLHPDLPQLVRHGTIQLLEVMLIITAAGGSGAGHDPLRSGDPAGLIMLLSHDPPSRRHHPQARLPRGGPGGRRVARAAGIETNVPVTRSTSGT